MQTTQNATEKAHDVMNQTPATAEARNPLGYETIPVLLRRFAIPSLIAMVVSSLYNIVDQIFIGQGVGYLGNAATNVAYPLTTICLSIALLIGIGGASRFSLSLGAGDKDAAQRAAGTAISMLAAAGVVYAVLIEIFLTPLMLAFGATGEVLPYAESYTRTVSYTHLDVYKRQFPMCCGGTGISPGTALPSTATSTTTLIL